MLNKGPWAVFGHLLLLIQRYKLGTKVKELHFDMFKIWFKMVNHPFLYRNETDIRFLIHNFLHVNAVRTRRIMNSPQDGPYIQTSLSILKRVTTDIHIDVSDELIFVEFVFESLPPKFYQRCRKIGHRIDTCEDDIPELDDVFLLPSHAAQQSSPMHAQLMDKPAPSTQLVIRGISHMETCGKLSVEIRGSPPVEVHGSSPTPP